MADIYRYSFQGAGVMTVVVGIQATGILLIGSACESSPFRMRRIFPLCCLLRMLRPFFREIS